MFTELAENATHTILNCPRCQTPLPGADHICPKCQVHVGIAAVKEANRIHTAVFKRPKSMAPEVLFPRLGDYLVRKGTVTRAELALALAHQKELAARNEPTLLGQILVDNGIINRMELDAAVTEQVIQLRAGLEKSNRELESQVAQRTSELQQAMQRLEELEKVKASFVAKVSHELRTPLTQLVGHLELLINEHFGPVSSSQRQALSSMNGASQRLWELIEDLLQFSAAATQNMTLDPKPFSLIEPVNTAVSDKKPQASNRKIYLSVRFAPDLPLVYADQDKITWVVRQLLDNAIKFTPPNGQVATYVRQKKKEVQVDVIDTGIGIPEDRIGELFRSFHQLEDYDTRRREGMGLGLTLAQQIVAAHGSQIQVRSRVGVGSHFAFTLPCHN